MSTSVDAAPSATPEEARAALARLRDPRTIRDRARRILDRARADQSPAFVLHESRLGEVADAVASMTRRRFPALSVPLHSRWRHFVFDGVDRWAQAARALDPVDGSQRMHAAIDLAVVSVLLDAGAGADWRFADAAGATYGRSEGLAAASLAAFVSGLFSADPTCPLRVDAAALAALTREALGAAFQVSAANPLLGLDGRLQVLQALGRTLQARPDVFGSGAPRPGHLVDTLVRTGAPIPAHVLLARVLDGFSEIWPARLSIAGQNLGDVWALEGVGGTGADAGLMPLHKLSQWLTYSLVEPVREAGIDVIELDSLTGLAEYRNGGLFLDYGVLELRDPTAATVAHQPSSPLIVEWRALTVALLDTLAPGVCERLGKVLPLAAVLEGGTWTVGRQIAVERRAGGTPPLELASDGTVF